MVAISLQHISIIIHYTNTYTQYKTKTPSCE